MDKTINQLFTSKKWTSFLDALPVDTPLEFPMSDFGEINSLRASATYLHKKSGYEKRFEITIPEPATIRIIASYGNPAMPD